MKKSYWICSAILVVIVLAMIVTAAVQDRKTKKAQVRKAAENTLISAGCIEVDDDYNPVKEEITEADLHSGDDVDLSGLENASNMIPQLKESGQDGQYLFNQVAGQILNNAKFYIVSTKVSGRDASVRVHLFYNGAEGEMTLEYFYYDGEWMLSNTLDAISELTVGGRDYDELSESAYNDIIKEMQNL